MTLKDNKKPLLVVVMFVILFILIFVILATTQNKNNSQISISNYDKFAQNLPQDRRTAINSALYNIIKNNSNNVNINDAIIRNRSYTEIYNKSENTYSSTFTIDVASIKQSYKVTLTWSRDVSVILKGDNLVFSCLPKDQLIYSDFNCNDILKIPILNNDPILAYLPHSTFNYTITVKPKAGTKIELNVNIYLYSYDLRDGNEQNTTSQYKKASTDWIESIGLNPDNYIINYIVNK